MARKPSSARQKTSDATRGADEELTPALPVPSEADVKIARLRRLIGTLWFPSDASPEQTDGIMKLAIDELTSIAPKDGIEKMLAHQMVATHSAAMECLRRGMIQGQSFEGRDQNLKHATKLLSVYVRQMEALDKHRGKGQQKITVEHVTVEAGGQAIVGNVERTPQGERSEAPAPALDYKPDISVPLELALGSRRKRVPIPAKAKGLDRKDD